MSEITNNTESTKKFFLDFSGLKTLWNKINSTFASKVELANTSTTLTSNINTVTGNLQILDNSINARVDGVEDTIDTFMPREFDTYTSAVNGSEHLSPGAVIKVLTDSHLLDEKGEPVKDENGEELLYKAGLYVVIDPKTKKIGKLSTASGSGTEADIESIADEVTQLNASVIKNAVVQDENGNQLSELSKINNTLIFKVDNEFKVNSESVNVLTHKAVAAMFGTLSDRISQIPKFKISIVDKLPEAEISLTTIYLVKNLDETSKNLYTEYIYVEKTPDDPNTDAIESEYVWEKLGEQTLAIDDFAKKTDVERMIAAAMLNVVTKEELDGIITNAKGEIFTEIEKTYLSKDDANDTYVNVETFEDTINNYYTKAETDASFLTKAIADSLYVKEADLEDFMTEPEVIAGILTGNIGDAIKISDEMINNMIIGKTE